MKGGIFNLLLFVFLSSFFLFLFQSCSSVSSAERYSVKAKEKTERDKSVRFSSDDDFTEFDSPPVENHPVDKEEIIKKYSDIENKTVLTPREKLLLKIIDFLNTPYSYGGESKKGIDCSAFTKIVFKQTLGVDLPRTASQQFETGKVVNRMENLSFGDLVFFNTTRTRFPGHVGIYIGGKLFAHSSVHRGVTVSSLESDYYKTKFVGGRRIYDFFKKNKY